VNWCSYVILIVVVRFFETYCVSVLWVSIVEMMHDENTDAQHTHHRLSLYILKTILSNISLQEAKVKTCWPDDPSGRKRSTWPPSAGARTWPARTWKKWTNSGVSTKLSTDMTALRTSRTCHGTSLCTKMPILLKHVNFNLDKCKKTVVYTRVNSALHI